MRVLLSFEEEYRIYMEAMADAIRVFRPNVEVATVDAQELEAEVERFDPQLVICSLPLPDYPVDNQLARIELSPEPDQPSRFRIGESRRESTNPTLGEILAVVDETKGLSRTLREQDLTDKQEAEG
jgi:hypothetical protein